MKEKNEQNRGGIMRRDKDSVKDFIRPFYKALFRFSVRRLRYSIPFIYFSQLFKRFPYEEMLENAMVYVSENKVEGDYLEFGVYEGNTFSSAYHNAQIGNLKSMRFYAFDSFEGLPKDIRGVDAKGFKQFKGGEFCLSLNEFKKEISSRGVNLNKVIIVKGWYDEVLNEKTKAKLKLKSAAVVWVDCDLYESTIPVLNFIKDYLVDGSVLIFDDWFLFRGAPTRGEQRAFREWLDKNPSIKATQFCRFGWNGNSFIIHRN